MDSFPLFFIIRAITFTCIMLFSLLWLILLCVEIFTRWSRSDQISQSLMVVFVLTNTITLIMLPMLILVQFRIWLDAARLLLLFVLQVGSAVAGSIWSSKIQCPDQTPDDLSVCQLIGIYTMIACWVIPAILIGYSTYFTIVVYLQSLIPVVVDPKAHKRRSGDDLEIGSTNFHSSWSEGMKEIIRVQGSNTDANILPRPLILPPIIYARQSSLPQSPAFHHQPTFPNVPHHQSTMPSLPCIGRQPILAHSSAPGRHYSLPTFKHGSRPALRPLLISSMPRPIATNVSPHHPQTPSSYSCSTPSSANPQNQLFSCERSAADAQPLGDRRWVSKHLSMMPLSASPTEVLSAEIRPSRAKLSKPLPSHLM